MKKTIIFTLISLIIHINSVCLAYTKVPTLEDAYAEAQNTKQKIVVVFGANWCGFCKKLDKDLQNNSSVLDDYIYVYVDIDDRKDLKKEYAVRNIPDIMILDDAVEVKRTVGYKGLDSFQKWLDE